MGVNYGDGEMPEWLNGHVLKTCRAKTLAGSNPALSAICTDRRCPSNSRGILPADSPLG